MWVVLNGRLVSEERALISVFDRAFLYGDGLFETLRIFNGQPFRWAQHIERLRRGAEFLNIQLPFGSEALLGFARELVAKNELPESLLRITVSRGVGVRGYSPKGADRPSLVMSLHPAPALVLDQPPQWKLVTSTFRLPTNEPLARFKTCNKLPQVLARAEADAANADEALLLNSDGEVVESSSGNLFWIERDSVCTSALLRGILPGVTRAVVLELCRMLGRSVVEAQITPEQLRRADGVFLSLSSVGLAECTALDESALKRSDLFKKLWFAYWDLVRKETSGVSSRTHSF